MTQLRWIEVVVFFKLLFNQNEVTLHSPFGVGLFLNVPPPANLSLHPT